MYNIPQWVSVVKMWFPFTCYLFHKSQSGVRKAIWGYHFQAFWLNDALCFSFCVVLKEAEHLTSLWVRGFLVVFFSFWQEMILLIPIHECFCMIFFVCAQSFLIMVKQKNILLSCSFAGNGQRTRMVCLHESRFFVCVCFFLIFRQRIICWWEGELFDVNTGLLHLKKTIFFQVVI